MIPRNFQIKKNIFPIIAVVFTALGGILILSSMNDGPGPPRKRTSMPSGFAPHMLEDRESSDAKIFMTVCTRCHGLADPKAHLAEEWPAVVVRMMDHMHRKAVYSKSVIVPKNEEVDQIIAYLSLHGLKKSSH